MKVQFWLSCYAMETWQTNKLQIHRLEVFHQSCLRWILRVKLFIQVRNSEILQRTNQSQSKLLMEIKRFRWFRDLSYMDDGRLPKYLLEWHPRHGKRTWGRKRTNWLSCIEEGLEMITGRVGIDYIQGRQMALNRSRLGKILRKASEVVVGQPYPHDDDG